MRPDKAISKILEGGTAEIPLGKAQRFFNYVSSLAGKYVFKVEVTPLSIIVKLLK